MFNKVEKNWIILMNIQMICFWILAIGFRFLPEGMKKPSEIIMGAMLVSFVILFLLCAVKPEWFRDKQTKGAN
jgi:membrane protein YdbS with pleckstrin-like domain